MFMYAIFYYSRHVAWLCIEHEVKCCFFVGAVVFTRSVSVRSFSTAVTSGVQNLRLSDCCRTARATYKLTGRQCIANTTNRNLGKVEQKMVYSLGQWSGWEIVYLCGRFFTARHEICNQKQQQRRVISCVLMFKYANCHDGALTL